MGDVLLRVKADPKPWITLGDAIDLITGVKSAEVFIFWYWSFSWKKFLVQGSVLCKTCIRAMNISELKFLFTSW